MELIEYVVTLHNYEDLNSFYDDMETPGGDLYIPNRAVELVDRRPISRSTHYMLSKEEVELISQDSRVMAVQRTMKDMGMHIKPLWNQTSSNWNKSNTVSSSHRNWGLLRVYEGIQRTNWGSNGTTNVSGSIRTSVDGTNVDVVIVDGHIDPQHPEFAVNSDGSGGSRVIQYNWFQDNPAVSGTPAGVYYYPPYVDFSYPDNNGNGISDRTEDNDHGAHVAGIAVGNSNGWARGSSIYNISPYSSNPSYTSNFIDYVRFWHQTKPINPLTGLRNPTITNHSYGISQTVSISSITRIRYKGVSRLPPFTATQLSSYGIKNDGTSVFLPSRASIAFEQDYIDAMAEGVIMIGAAGNTQTKIDNFSLNVVDDYNNRLDVGAAFYYYNRGSISAIDGMICVGSINANVIESKSTFSESGPRVDVYSPGQLIMSSIDSQLPVSVTDSRNAAYSNTKKSGTSMASPQVAGLIACLAEIWPRISQSDAVTYIHTYAKYNQITATDNGPADSISLQGSENRYLAYKESRLGISVPIPRANFGSRPATGQLWPRSNILRYGK